MANIYPLVKENFSKTKLELKIFRNRYKDADCEKRIEYANKLTAMMHVYLSTPGLKKKRTFSRERNRYFEVNSFQFAIM